MKNYFKHDKKINKRFSITAMIAVAFLCIFLINGCGSSVGSDRSTINNTEDPSASDKDKDPSGKAGTGEKSSSGKKKTSKKKDDSSSSSKKHERLPSSDNEDKVKDTSKDPAEIEDEISRARSREDYDGIIREESGIYRKLKEGKDVNILINGDSIGAGGGSTNGNSWTDLLKDYIESEYSVSCNLTNISLGGNGSYAGYVLENILDDGIDYDLMIICYGENDDRKSLPFEYEALIRSAEKKYPSCNIISILESSQREYTSKIETIEGLAEYYDILTADTIAAFNDSGKDYEDLTVDVKHPNDEGYRLYFETVKEIIDRETENETGVEYIERTPLDPEVSGYDSFRYFPVEDFVRINPVTYSISLKKGVRGMIGLYHPFCTSNGEIIIKADGKVIVRRPMTWTYDFTQDFIYRPDNEVRSASGQIEISFPTSEMADGFKGMIFSGG